MNFIQILGHTVQNNNRSIENLLMKKLKHQVQSILALLFLLSAYLLPLNTAHALEPKQKPMVSSLLQAFKQNNRVAISRMVSYPLLRQEPLASINNPDEFLRRFDDIFDVILLNKIVRSNINTDWDSIGWRGVILNNGVVALDPDGNITAINYLSRREQALINKQTAHKVVSINPKGRRVLHRSVTKYSQAVVEITTKRFHIRIDDVGQGKLRYASWPINKSTSDKPDLILNDGRLLQSSGRNQRFVFQNGTYSYQLNINSTDLGRSVTGSLVVFKGGQPWTREVATKVIRR